MDSHDSRRAAEKTTRDLLANSYLTTIGDLAAAAEQHRDAVATLATARGTAQEALAQARTHAAALLDQTRTHARDTDLAYTAARAAALAAGWTDRQLTDLGHPRPRARTGLAAPAEPATGMAPAGGTD